MILLLALLLQRSDSLPAKPPAPPVAWLALIGAYAAERDTLYVYEDRGALALLVKPSAPARLAQASESVFTFTGPHLYDAERVVFRAGVPAATGGRSARARGAGAQTPRLRAVDPRRLPAVVRDEGVLGRDAARVAVARGRSRPGLEAQPRRRGGYHIVRPGDGAAGGDALDLRRGDTAGRVRLPRRHVAPAVAPRLAAPRARGRGVHGQPERVVALRLSRLAALSDSEPDVRRPAQVT